MRNSHAARNGSIDMDFRASSNTPVRLLGEGAREDDLFIIISELRREIGELKERERKLVEFYQAKIRDLEQVHKSDVAMLLEESKRLDNALLCIRGLCDFQQTAERDESPCADDLLAAVLSEAGFSDGSVGEIDEIGEIEEQTVVHHVLLDGHANIDLCTPMAEVQVVEDEANAGTEDGDMASYDSSDNGSVVYTRGDDVCVKDSFCPIRDFRGEDPGVITENGLDRILDHPSSTYEGNTAQRSHRFKHAMDAMDAREGRVYAQAHAQPHTQPHTQSHSVDSPAEGWKIPSVHTRTRLYAEVEALEKKLRNRQLAAKQKIAVDSEDNNETDKQNDTELNDTSNCHLMLDQESDDEFVRTIKALGDSSPTMANLLTQHVSDSWVGIGRSLSSPGAHTP